VQLSAKQAAVDQIAPWRDLYRQEMNCQVIHDSIHYRPGWTQEYVLHRDGAPVGYGSVAIAGPWNGKPTIYEFYLLPQHRTRVFDCFAALVEATRAVAIETQSNDALLTALLHTFAQNVAPEAILFHDGPTTTQDPPQGAAFRPLSAADSAGILAGNLDSGANWVLELEGSVAAAGDILYHYNRPYGDIYMKVADGFRNRGLGAYLVQELKRICYEGGSVPAARCNVSNIASRKTLQRAGFVPCGHILAGRL
jgi:GNAT superfamily N-acetyltransferase